MTSTIAYFRAQKRKMYTQARKLDAQAVKIEELQKDKETLTRQLLAARKQVMEINGEQGRALNTILADAGPSMA